MKPPPLDYFRPETLADAVEALRLNPDHVPISGGQSLLPMLNLRVTGPAAVINLARLPELRTAVAGAGTVRIGAAITHAEIEDGKVPDPSRGMMPKVAAGIAYRAVRNFGTIGGAVALSDPAADWPACLMALATSALIVGPASERRMQMEALILGPYATALEPQEIITEFEIPTLGPDARWGWRKLARKQGAYADSIGAAVWPGNGAPPRIVFGANGDRPVLLTAVSSALSRRPDLAGAELRAVVMEEIHSFDPGADTYRLRCHVATVERAITQASAA